MNWIKKIKIMIRSFGFMRKTAGGAKGELGVFRFVGNRFYCYYHLLRVSGKLEELKGATIIIYMCEDGNNIIRIDELLCAIESKELDNFIRLLKRKGIDATIEQKCSEITTGNSLKANLH